MKLSSCSAPRVVPSPGPVRRQKRFLVPVGTCGVLSIDGCGDGAEDALLAAAALARQRPGCVSSQVSVSLTPMPTRPASPRELARLTAEGVTDIVDESVAMAFGRTCRSNYSRVRNTAKCWHSGMWSRCSCDGEGCPSGPTPRRCTRSRRI